MEKSENRFPEELVQIRVQAGSSYQIKRVIEVLEGEKGLELMSQSGIMTNRGAGPKLRQDLKAEKKKLQKNQKRKFRL